MCVLEGMQRDTDLVQIMRALDVAGGFSRRLDRGQKQRHQRGQRGNDDQQLKNGNAARAAHLPRANWPADRRRSRANRCQSRSPHSMTDRHVPPNRRVDCIQHSLLAKADSLLAAQIGVLMTSR